MSTTSPPLSPPSPIDVLDPHFYDDPWEAYRWLRENDPVHRDEANDLWVVSRHEEVSLVSRDAARYSAASGVRPRLPVPLSIIAMDDPDHTAQRRLVNRGFTPRKVRDLADHIREVSKEIVEEISDRGQIDFVREFAIHVPLIVIAEMIGLDPSMRERLYEWSEAMMAGDGHVEEGDPVMERAAEAFGAYTSHCQELIEERRQVPKDDIISMLTGAFDRGELLELDSSAGSAGDAASDLEMEDIELLMFLVLLVVAGNETTRNALSGGLLAFSEFPGERDRLIAHPELMDLAVDEIVRYVSPVLGFSRTVTETHQLQGRTLNEGDQVLMLYQSANRDAKVFDEPDRFRIDRDPNPHLAFGIGTHYCLGANLARAEIKVVFEELFARLPDIRVPEGHVVDRGASSLVLAINQLPAVFSAVA